MKKHPVSFKLKNKERARENNRIKKRNKSRNNI